MSFTVAAVAPEGPWVVIWGSTSLREVFTSLRNTDKFLVNLEREREGKNVNKFHCHVSYSHTLIFPNSHVPVLTYSHSPRCTCPCIQRFFHSHMLLYSDSFILSDLHVPILTFFHSSTHMFLYLHSFILPNSHIPILSFQTHILLFFQTHIPVLTYFHSPKPTYPCTHIFSFSQTRIFSFSQTHMSLFLGCRLRSIPSMRLSKQSIIALCLSTDWRDITRSRKLLKY